jgi:hypothetical protein
MPNWTSIEANDKVMRHIKKKISEVVVGVPGEKKGLLMFKGDDYPKPEVRDPKDSVMVSDRTAKAIEKYGDKLSMRIKVQTRNNPDKSTMLQTGADGKSYQVIEAFNNKKNKSWKNFSESGDGIKAKGELLTAENGHEALFQDGEGGFKVTRGIFQAMLSHVSANESGGLTVTMKLHMVRAYTNESASPAGGADVAVAGGGDNDIDIETVDESSKRLPETKLEDPSPKRMRTEELRSEDEEV